MQTLLEDNDFMLLLTLIFILCTFALVVFCSLPCTAKCFSRMYNCLVKGRRVEDGSRWDSNGNVGSLPAPVPSFAYGISPFTTATSSFTTRTTSIINLSSPAVSQANAIYAVNHHSLPIYSEVDIAPPSYESLYPNPPVTYTNTDELKSLFVDSCLQPRLNFNSHSKSNVQEDFHACKPREG